MINIQCIRNWLLRNGEGAAAIYFNKMVVIKSVN